MDADKQEVKLTLEAVGAEFDAVYVATRKATPESADPKEARDLMVAALTLTAIDLTGRNAVSHVQIACNEENNPPDVLARGDLVVSVHFLFLGEGTLEKLDSDSSRIVDMNLFTHQDSARQSYAWGME